MLMRAGRLRTPGAQVVTMKRQPDITVVLTTFNNAEELRRTLEGFRNSAREGVEVEFAVVDNSSTDTTKSVVEASAAHLPIRYLHEPRQGKCAALNHALQTLDLGRLVFFTDDDVDVPGDWLCQVCECGLRNPATSVFGGPVHLVWPPGKVPDWAEALARSYRAYSHLDLGEREHVFPPGQTPVGTNWWLRREVLERGYRFDERIGPGTQRCSMGDETAFLLRLAQDGYKIQYVPPVRVGHRVPNRMLVERQILRRGLAAGAAGAILAYEYGFGPARYVRSDLGWRLLRGGCLLRWVLWYAAAFLSLSKPRRVLRRWDAMQGIGWNWEALRIASGRYTPMALPLQPGHAGIGTP